MRAIVGVQMVRERHGQSAWASLQEPASLRHRVGYMTQLASIYEDLSVRQNLRYFARIQGAPKSDVDRVIERTDLGEAGRSIGQHALRRSGESCVVGGRDARVARVFVLDEPTVGLDPVLRSDLWDIFRRLADEGRRCWFRVMSWMRRLGVTGCF